MVFWGVIGIVLLVVLLAAWRMDRRRTIRITRRNGRVELDIATAQAASIHNYQRAQGMTGPPLNGPPA